MDKREYLNTPEGQASRYNYRKLRRIYFRTKITLRSKRSKRETEEVELQRELRSVLKKHHRASFKGPVILEMNFSTNQPNPPAIHSLPKHYIDLLQKPLIASKISGDSILLADDRQVKILIVNFHLGDEPSMRLKITRLSHFQDDLELLARIRASEFTQYRFGEVEEEIKRKIDADDDDENINELSREIREIDIERNFWIQTLGEQAFKAMRAMAVTRFQQHALRANARFIRRRLLDMLRRPIGRNGPFALAHEELERRNRDIILMPTFTLELASTPQRAGDGDLFREKIQNALTEFKKRNPLFFPLRTLISVTILYIPPRNRTLKAQEVGIDLDNLARQVIPRIHEIIEPPSTFLRTIDLDMMSDSDLKEDWEKAAKAEAGYPKHSITRYEIIELPRFDSDENVGTVRVVFGDGTHPASIWDDVDDWTGEWADAVT